MIDRTSQIWRAKTLVSTLCHSGYFGSVTFQFEHGNIVSIGLEEHKRMSVPELVNLLEVRLEKGEIVTVRKAPRGGDSGITLVSLERRGALEIVVPVSHERLLTKAD